MTNLQEKSALPTIPGDEELRSVETWHEWRRAWNALMSSGKGADVPIAAAIGMLQTAFAVTAATRDAWELRQSVRPEQAKIAHEIERARFCLQLAAIRPTSCSTVRQQLAEVAWDELCRHVFTGRLTPLASHDKTFVRELIYYLGHGMPIHEHVSRSVSHKQEGQTAVDHLTQLVQAMFEAQSSPTVCRKTALDPHRSPAAFCQTDLQPLMIDFLVSVRRTEMLVAVHRSVAWSHGTSLYLTPEAEAVLYRAAVQGTGGDFTRAVVQNSPGAVTYLRLREAKVVS